MTYGKHNANDCGNGAMDDGNDKDDGTGKSASQRTCPNRTN